MVTTRRRKVELVAEELPELEVFGAKEADVLVVGWGGTRGHLHSAVKQLQEEGNSSATSSTLRRRVVTISWWFLGS